MHFTTLLSATALTLSAVTLAVPQKGMAGMGSKKPSSASYMSAEEADTLVAKPSFVETELAQSELKDGAKRVTISYGPFMLGAKGTVNAPSLMMKKPCEDCYVTAFEASLHKAADNSVATASQGYWLHHMVLSGTSSGILFASGNERTPTRLNRDYKYGMYIPATDNWNMITELMSMADVSTPVNVVMTYEYIPKAEAEGYKAAYMLWEDVGYPPARKGVYNFETLPRLITTPGKLLWNNGHVHDAGTSTVLYLNGKDICNSTMLYGRRPGYLEPAMGSMPASDHISDASVCMNFGEVKKGDIISMKAFYNTNEHALMVNPEGGEEELMGINRVYIGP